MRWTEDRVRAQTERALGFAVSEDWWEYVSTQTAWLESVLDEEDRDHYGDIAWLVGQMHTIPRWEVVLKAGAASPAEPGRSLHQAHSGDAAFTGFLGTIPVIARQDALCAALAALAAQDVGVRAFRREALGDQFLRWPDFPDLDFDREFVDAWLTRHGVRALSSYGTTEAAGSAWPLLPCIRFLSTGEEWLAVPPDGVLDRLRQLAERLADQYHWTPAAAAAFVLTGIEPNVPTFRVTIRPNHQLSALTRVVIEVDPQRTPEDMAAVYKQVRGRLFQTQPHAMSAKHLRLGAFAAPRPPREPLADQLAAWNAAVPDPAWRYEMKHTANFARDRKRALARLLRPDYRLPDHEETISYDDFTR